VSGEERREKRGRRRRRRGERGLLVGEEGEGEKVTHNSSSSVQHKE
jgi:hypothetical protein